MRSDGFRANARAQLARILFTVELVRSSPEITAFAVHPGAVLTSAHATLPLAIRLLIRTVLRPGLVRPELGALPALRLATRPELGLFSGRFFDRFRPTHDGADPGLAADLWTACRALAGSRSQPCASTA